MGTSTKIETFRNLHRSGCFVIPNPWDAGTAIYLERLGFKALATTSAGLGFSLGKVDGVDSISFEETLKNIQAIVRATSLPVNADFQNGFAESPEKVAENVKKCIATGVAGLSIEDATGVKSKPIYSKEFSVERIKAARAAIDSTENPIFLTGRCEFRLFDETTPLKMIIERLVGYAEAGADCLYAPGIQEPSEIQAIVNAIAPKPINVVIRSTGSSLSIQKMSELGVRRVSLGSALARTAWGAFMRASKDILENGSFEGLSSAASFSELNEIFSHH